MSKTLFVHQKQDVETKISSSSHELYHNAFVYRVFAFTVNGTLIVDMKLPDSKAKGRLGSSLNKSDA